MADYIRCCRGEKFFAPTILYQMQQITPYILPEDPGMARFREWQYLAKSGVVFLR